MKKVFIFLAGAALGSVVTYKLTERYFNKLIDEEIESVKETFKERLEKELKDQPDENIDIISESKGSEIKEEYDKKMKDLGYKTGVDLAEEGTESQQVETIENIENDEDEDDSEYLVPIENGKDIVPPYVITEEEFGEYGNEEETLMFFADGKLVDEDESLIVDPESVIGDALQEFYDDPYAERVYVRDENKEKDYIILKSEKTYQEVYGEEE